MFDAIFLYFLQSMPQSQSQTVVVENPMSVDESGKLVSLIIDIHVTCFCYLDFPSFRVLFVSLIKTMEFLR